MNKKILVAIAAISVLFLGACSKKESDGIKISTTFYPMYEFTKEVVKDKAEVSYVVPAGQEVHDYEPSARDMANLSDSDVIVYNNDELETWFASARKNINSNSLIINASKDVKLKDFEDNDNHDHDHGHEDSDHKHTIDPHTWLSLRNAQVEVQTIADQLSDKYPDYKEDFQKNAKEYKEKLAVLDKEYSTDLTNAKNKKFVTQHAAFGYLARDYDLTPISIAGLTPDAEPSSSTIASLKHLMEENKLHYVYFEENADDKIAKTLAKEVGAETLVLNPIEGITDKEQKDGATYISIMEQNLINLKKSIK